MKKIVIIFVIFFSPLLRRGAGGEVFAQPNGGFENWSTVSNYQDPDNWQTLNFMSLFSNPLSAFKATGVDKHSGNYALKLKTIFINNNPFTNMLPDTANGAFTGKIITSPFAFKLGVPYTGRPEKLEFWAKYVPVGDDVAGAFLSLQKWNGTSTDTIANGNIKILSTIAYTFFQVNLDYLSNELPDTVVIGFTSSDRQSLARVGSTFCVDDVVLTGWVGIDESRMCGTDNLKVFPNPARNNVSIKAHIEEADNLQITDVTGKLAGIYKIQNYGAEINTSAFAEGIYFFEIRDKKDRILTKGKFNVIK